MLAHSHCISLHRLPGLDELLVRHLSWWEICTSGILPHVVYVVQLGDRGRLVLPAELRRRLGLRAGDRLVILPEPDGSLRLVLSQEVVKATRGLFRHLRKKGRSRTQEFLAERRTEAMREP